MLGLERHRFTTTLEVSVLALADEHSEHRGPQPARAFVGDLRGGEGRRLGATRAAQRAGAIIGGVGAPLARTADW
jgi:hypothetical protein